MDIYRRLLELERRTVRLAETQEFARSQQQQINQQINGPGGIGGLPFWGRLPDSQTSVFPAAMAIRLIKIVLPNAAEYTAPVDQAGSLAILGNGAAFPPQKIYGDPDGFPVATQSNLFNGVTIAGNLGTTGALYEYSDLLNGGYRFMASVSLRLKNNKPALEQCYILIRTDLVTSPYFISISSEYSDFVNLIELSTNPTVITGQAISYGAPTNSQGYIAGSAVMEISWA